MSGARHWEQDKEATCYVGNLDERVTDALVWELMLQVGRIVNVHLPKDRVTQTHQGYGFVQFISEEDAEYASRIMNGIRMFGKPIRVNKASAEKDKGVEVGAELFIGNLDPMVTEDMLHETFSRFGLLANPPKIARDDSHLSKGYGFISFADFEASDAAIAGMDGQHLMNKQCTVQYAYKKDGRGERHGDEAERMLADQARKHNFKLPTQQVSTPFPGAGSVPPVTPMQIDDNSHPLSATPMTPDVSIGHVMPMAYQNAPPLQRPPQHMAPPIGIPMHMPMAPLVAAPPGLPARPPPSQAGYGGPQSFHPSGYVAPPGQQPPFAHQGAPPGFAPPGFAPPGFAPPGFAPPGFPREVHRELLCPQAFRTVNSVHTTPDVIRRGSTPC
ncbi:splicing factor 3b subunit 4 [Penicillium taxi]|uniref:splicing factor 3b subunit 4 n=1 Tax=Penicillium taxi TaxID=168475 RepID=UPI0025450E2E|nr:splicing factor 3b subunit 4 [Penicillium taxi]KAJ5902495.1 splicing factor 3b subunit 4 [Penicillium taxi]